MGNQGDPPKRTWRAGALVYTPAALVMLFLWLLWGDFAWAMRDRSVGPMASWYLSHLNVSSLLFGLLMTSFPALITLVIAPTISYISDRHRGRMGRRIPFLLITTPLSAAGMIGLGLTPLVSSYVHAAMPGQDETVVALISFGVFWAVFEVASIASQAVFGGLINDVVPRELLGRFYGLFRAVSLIDGIIFNFWIMGKVPTHYTLILVVIGIFYGVAFMVVCFKIKEGDYPPPPAEEPARRGIVAGFGHGARTYFKECFQNPYYLLVFCLTTFAGLAFIPVNTFSIPYAASVGVDMDLYGKYMALTFIISLALSFFLGWLADIFHPLRMAMAFLVLYVGVGIWGSFSAATAQGFLLAWVLHVVVSGCYFTSAASLGQRLYPQSRYAQFGSAAGIIGSIGGILVSPAVGSLIDVTGRTYRLTFAAGGVLALIALVASVFVYRRFVGFGGPTNYVAPE